MDACVMFEETSLKDFKTATKKHCPMLSERHGRESLAQLLLPFFTFHNFNCARISKTSHFCE